MAISFNGRYEVNANQPMATTAACIRRDYVLGFCAGRAKNGNAIIAKVRSSDPSAACNVVFDVPDANDKDFEEVMNVVGQKFKKLA